MSRGLEFNAEKALNAATKIFWTQGYKKTSVQSLMKAMKLGESSFYNTYKSKKNLYLLCLENYNSDVTARRLEILQSNESIGKKIRNFFDSAIEDQYRPGATKGCMMTNCLSYEVLNDKDLSKYVEDEFFIFKRFLKGILDQAKKEGELSKDFDTLVVSNLLFTHLQGVFKVALLQKDSQTLKKQTHAFIQHLGL